MEDQYRSVIRQKIVDSEAAPPPPFTRRDVWLPTVPGKAVAVGKDTLHDYLGHLEDAFLLRSLAIATDSERRRRNGLCAD